MGRLTLIWADPLPIGGCYTWRPLLGEADAHLFEGFRVIDLCAEIVDHQVGIVAHAQPDHAAAEGSHPRPRRIQIREDLAAQRSIGGRRGQARRLGDRGEAFDNAPTSALARARQTCSASAISLRASCVAVPWRR